jgi:response regulator RpfG family c-di-GMP phosphodiesterase
MPGKSGVEVFDKIRKDSDLMSIPVCIITGKPELRKLIYERPVAPPEGYLDKPISERDLILNIRKIFELSKHEKIMK